MNSVTFWDNIAEKYAKDPIRDEAAYRHTLDQTIAHLEPTQKGLEIGCGTGSTAILLAPHLAHLTATDLSPEMIRIAKGRQQEAGAENLSFEVAEAGRLHAEAPFDVVLAHTRHLLSQYLPDIIRQLDQQAIFQTGKGNFVTVQVIEPAGHTVDYGVFFTVTRGRSGEPLKLRVSSAYPFFEQEKRYQVSRQRIRFNIIVYNTMLGKPIRFRR